MKNKSVKRNLITASALALTAIVAIEGTTMITKADDVAPTDQAVTQGDTDSSDQTQTASEDESTPQTATDAATQSDTYLTGTNESVDANNNVTANVDYQGTTYDVNGPVGQTSAANSSDGQTIYVNISKYDVQDLSSGSTVTLDGNAGMAYNLYHNDETDAGAILPNDNAGDYSVTQQMTSSDGNETYYLIDKEKDQWVKKSNNVILNGDPEATKTSHFTYRLVDPSDSSNSENKVENNGEGATFDNGTISGSVKVHSINYNQDFTYSYSGKDGDVVQAELTDVTLDEYPQAPVVMVTLYGGGIYTVANGTLDVTATGLYPVYETSGGTTMGESTGRSATNGSVLDNVTKEIRTSNGDVYYIFSRRSNNIVKGKIDGFTNISEDAEPSDENVAWVTTTVSEPVIADVTIKSNQPDQVVKDQIGNIGDTINNITVPTISGYTADKTTISAIVNPDRTITPLEEVVYTKKTSSGSGSSSSSNELGYGYLDQTIATYPDNGNVKLYSIEGNSLTPVTNRALAAGTDWFTDQMVTTANGVRYYRVATNEWAKADDVYLYEAINKVLTVDEQTDLINAEQNTVTNRALAANTSWKVDRIAYLGDYRNPVKADRVATDEFVQRK